jgi:hypothetical protein
MRPPRAVNLLTLLCEGQEATVLQLPAQAKTADEAREQERELTRKGAMSLSADQSLATVERLPQPSHDGRPPRHRL